jgi:hypothetical protein
LRLASNLTTIEYGIESNQSRGCRSELADVHAVVAYYLRHRDAVRAYLERRKEEASSLKAHIEAERPRVSRAELLARRSATEAVDAPTSH